MSDPTFFKFPLFLQSYVPDSVLPEGWTWVVNASHYSIKVFAHGHEVARTVSWRLPDHTQKFGFRILTSDPEAVEYAREVLTGMREAARKAREVDEKRGASEKARKDREIADAILRNKEECL